MKRYTSLFIFLSFIFICPHLARGRDFSGQWLGTITESINRCDNLGKAKPGEYKLTITHNVNNIVVMENVVQRPYTGVFNPQNRQFAHVQGSYVTHGGYVTELLDIEFDSGNNEKGKGKSIWRWSDGYYSCGGTFNFTLVKQKP